MDRSGLAPELTETPESDVPLRRAAAFVDEIERREGIDCLGLLVGARTPRRILNFGLILSHSLTLKDLLRRILRYVPGVDTGARVWLEQVPERDSVRLRICIKWVSGKSIIDGYGMMVLLNAVRHATGPEWRPTQVRIDTDCRHVRDRFEALSEARIETGADHSAFEVPLSLLPNRFQCMMPVESAESSGPGWSPPPSDLAGVLAAVIRACFGSRVPDAMEVADLAGISVRTLQRHLAGEGYRFRELVDEVRFDERARALPILLSRLPKSAATSAIPRPRILRTHSAVGLVYLRGATGGDLLGELTGLS